MAALDYLSATTHRNLIPVLTDNVFRSNPLMVLLIRKTVKVDGGATFAAPIRINRNPVGSSYSGADMLQIQYDTANTIGAEWNWSQYGRLLGVTGLDELRNSGIRAIVNLIKTSLDAIELELREDMGADLYSDGTNNGSRAFVGLKAAVDDGTVGGIVTYGAISRTTYPNWKANVAANSNAGRALTLPLINSNWQNAVKDNDMPGVIMTTHGVWSKYLNLVQPLERLAAVQQANVGYQQLSYLGRPLIIDEQVQTSPTHDMWFLNLKYFTFYTSSGRNFLMVPFQQLPQQDAIVAKILWAGQLVCTSPRMQLRITDLDPTL